MAPADAEVLRDDPATREAMLDDFRNPAPTTARATARDFALFAKPWDIDLGAVAAHVDVWHGDEDRNVPVQHGRLLARVLPDAELHEIEGGGHLLLGQLDDVLGGLSGGRP
jgi:pimeloyl-ACP methyl ester carboxylesterase